MSDYQQKDFTGALFKNDKRETDNHPMYKGSATIDGKEYWVSCWVNESAKGTKYMSLKYAEKEAAHNAGMAQAKEALQPADDFEDDSIPF
mgnify:CR=1 FL=1